MRVCILGCGYVGLAAARALAAQGHDVLGVRRGEAGRAEVEAAGVRFAAADITRAEELQALPGPFDWVVNAVSSSRGGLADYRAAYETGNRRVLDWAATQPLRKLVYTSSTSVYGQVDGSWVDETSPAAPGTEAGQILIAAESLLLESARRGGPPAVVLRVAGIYGPGRGHLFHQFLAGEARIEGDGGRWLNMIHRDDAASAVAAALDRGRPGCVYNVVDDEPAAQGDFLRGVARLLGRPPPPSGPPPAPGARKRATTHKRVSNRRLRSELDWRPAYPTWREGYADPIRAVLDAQGLNTEAPPAVFLPT